MPEGFALEYFIVQVLVIHVHKLYNRVIAVEVLSAYAYA